MQKIETKEAFKARVAEIEAEPGYARPRAFAIGVSAVDEQGNLLDAFFPMVNHRENYGTAAILAEYLGYLSGVAEFRISRSQLNDVLNQYFGPYLNDEEPHANIETIKFIIDFAGRSYRTVQPVVAFIPDETADPGPRSVADAYLRLHLLSHRKVKPRELSLDGIFGVLPNVAWTSIGPMAVSELPKHQLAHRLKGEPLLVHGVDKFPRMIDYVVPSGVRIADGARVRLGAYLGEGTTVMHEGFVNFNAGTLGKSMVEGRISASVVVGDGSDLGGSASIMGTLSGGGKEVISVGERCLIGANAGIGISLGDDCIVEAGCYITAGAKIAYLAPGAARAVVCKARELSGKSGLLFRRNSETGKLEAVPNRKAVELNETLHAKQ